VIEGVLTKCQEVQPLGLYFARAVVVHDQTPPEAVALDAVRVQVTNAAVPEVRALLAPFPKVPLMVTAPSVPNAIIAGYPSPVTAVVGISDVVSALVVAVRMEDVLMSLNEQTVGPTVVFNVLRPSAKQASIRPLSAPTSVTALATWDFATESW
jgi:hypothetical protein